MNNEEDKKIIEEVQNQVNDFDKKEDDKKISNNLEDQIKALKEKDYSDQLFKKDNKESNSNNENSTNRTIAILGIVFGVLYPLIGLILSLIAYSNVKKDQPKTRKLARAGVITSAVFFGISILFTMIFFWSASIKFI
ncbi:DUF4190 domain-containing protein [Mycoplasma struthionis]|uniref:DUF4190 domain-containing protein n=1 Tax=Mycoplasma struthionis TaxID=538220 RepID=A0A502M1K4_9MOLU|nr:DUF4190 domain-containing protein [Mycoplasma struthionis]TPI01311.1 DUF4190 domain-containing protein [Mycoplasma struthionis]